MPCFGASGVPECCMHTATATDLLTTIGRSGQLSPEAMENLKLWLEDPALVEFAPEIQALVKQGDWSELEDAFYKHLNIGTGGIRVASGVRDIRRLPLGSGGERWVTQIGPEVDEAYLAAVASLSVEQSRSARITFSAIHGAGKTNVLPVLQRAGFDVRPVAEQLEPDPNFPTAAGKLINPEYREVVALPLQYAETVDADLAICAYPDADRAPVCARPTSQG